MQNSKYRYGNYKDGNEILFLPHNYKNIRLASKPLLFKNYGNTIFPYQTDNINISFNKKALYWFRWTIGHHVSFICWTLIAKYLEDYLILIDSNTKDSNLERCIAMIHLMNCMYIYTATVPADIYKSEIRKFMELYFSGFSATWAKDYVRLKNVIQQLTNKNDLCLSETEVLKLFGKSKVVHLVIADKLVKNRQSLLQQLHNTGQIPKPNHAHIIYDHFFLVSRVSHISENTLLKNLIIRLQVIAGELEHNTLLDEHDSDAEMLLTKRITSGYIKNFPHIIQNNIDVLRS